jgi:hypothetical protein
MKVIINDDNTIEVYPFIDRKPCNTDDYIALDLDTGQINFYSLERFDKEDLSKVITALQYIEERIK